MSHLTKLMAGVLLLTAGCAEHVRHAGRRVPHQIEASPIEMQTESTAAQTPIVAAHPRLFVHGTFAPCSPNDPQVVRWQEILTRKADALLTQPLVAYSPDKLLGRSREALRRSSMLAGLFQLPDDPKYRAAAPPELLNISSFPNWLFFDIMATAE